MTDDKQSPEIKPKRVLVNQLNDLSAKEWIPETVSVWTQKGLGKDHKDTRIERMHPAPFSYQDVARLVTFFTKANEWVLDPFVGVGSTLKACAINGRNGIGIELNERYVELTNERLESEVDLMSTFTEQKVLQGDARVVVNDLDENSIDLVLTSPPYWNILHKEDHKVKQERVANNLDTRYSDEYLDLGNISDYNEFLKDLSSILGACGRVLKPKKYMCVIVSDFRDKSSYIMFHSDLAQSLLQYGFELKGITILYQRHKRVFPYGYPYSYVPNIHHQYILILQNLKKL